MPLDDMYDPGDALKDMSVLFVTVYCGMLLFFRTDNHSDGSSDTDDGLKCAHVKCVDICLFFVSSIGTV